MIFELFYVTIAAAFIVLVALGHALLFSAIYRCLRDDWDIGGRSNREPPLPRGALPVSRRWLSENENSGDVPGLVPLPNPSTANR